MQYAKVPRAFEPVFVRAQEFVSNYFSELKGDAHEGTIETAGERYLLVRAASMSVDFFETVKDLYKGAGENEAISVAQNLLFDIAHAIGKADARSFQKKMKLDDPLDKLSAGPIHFAYSGWAFVNIFPESNPTPDENYYLIYDHPFSFESAAWLKARKKSSCPVCIMNAGYSSGWCEESFGMPLVAQEIMCKAAGDEACRFIMAPPSKIKQHIERYVRKRPSLAKRVSAYEVPGFFKRKEIEQNLRASQAALQASEKRYRAVVDNVGIGISLISPKMEILTLNKQMKSWFPDIDVSKKPICYESFNDPPRNEICSYCPTYKTLKDGKVHEDTTQTPLGGEIRNYRIVSTPVFDSKGKVESAIEMVEDITERKKMEEELRAARNNMEQRVELRTAELKRSQKLYQTLAEAAEDYIFIIRPDMTVQYVNDFGAKALRKSKDDIMGRDLRDLFSAGSSSRMEKAIGRVFSSGEAISAENPLQLPDHEIWLHTHLVPLKDDKGVVTGVMGLSRDVTERRGYEERLKLTQTTMDHVSSAIYWVGQDGRFVYVNNQACEQLGYDRAELLRMSVQDIDPRFSEKEWRRHWQDVKGRKSFVMESRHRRKDGTEFPVEVMVNYLEHKGREFHCAIVLDISARKDAEEALKQSESRYRGLFEDSPIALWEEDFSDVKEYVDGIVSSKVDDVEKYFLDHPELMFEAAEKIKAMDVNKAALKLLRAKSKEDLWHNRMRFITERSFPIFSGIIATLAEGRRTYHGEGSGLNLAGERVDVKMDFTVLPGYEYNYGKVLISMADITQQKRAEQELRQSEARLRTAVESFPFDFFIIGLDGRYAMVNMPCTGNWGNILGKRPEDIPVDEKTMAIWMENNRRAFAGEIVRGEVEMTVHGQTKYFYNIIAPIRDEGKIYGILGVNLDITERKLADEALKESERRFQQVAESAEEWIWEVNEHGLYTYSNDVVEEILGYKPDELVGMMHFYDLFTSKDREKLKGEVFKYFENRKRFKDVVNINVHKNGSEVILEASGSPIIDRKGKLVGYRGVDTDITERKKAEQTLKSALKMKSEFMAMMSHELRTPLTRIISSTHLVLSDPDAVLPDKRRVNLSNVLASSDALLLMINNVLEMARLEGGTVPVVSRECDIAHLVRSCISSCEGMTGEKNIQFVKNIEDDAAFIYTDKEKLGHILMNLICNGIRYSDEGTVEISVKASPKKGYVDIEVSDEGIGIPPDRILELFEPFKQLEEISKRRPGGIGLGLSIVKANLELIGGTIDVKSEVGKGSTFTITVPREISKKKDKG